MSDDKTFRTPGDEGEDETTAEERSREGDKGQTGQLAASSERLALRHDRIGRDGDHQDSGESGEGFPHVQPQWATLAWAGRQQGTLILEAATVAD